MLVLDQKIWTVIFEQLLVLQPKITKKITEPKETIYSLGRNEMVKVIKRTNDYFSNTPLEIAYRWALPVQSFKKNRLILNGKLFGIDCEALRMGRIFDGDTAFKSMML